MVRLPASGWCRHTWAACGLLAIISVALLIVAGCASGGAEPQMQTGAVTVYTYDADAPADASARFFYSVEGDIKDTVWNESRTAWCVEATPKEAIGAIGLETAPYTKESPYPEFLLNSADGSKSVKLDATAMVYVVNNWDRPITITETSAPEKDLFYRLPTMDEINAATMGQSKTNLRQWLLDGPGLYASECAPFLFPNGFPLNTTQEYEDGWLKAFFNAIYPASYPDGIDGTLSKYLLSVNVNYTAIQNQTIAAGSRSSQPMKIALNYAAVEDPQGYQGAPWPWDQAVAIAFSTYFGVTVDFTYPPDP